MMGLRLADGIDRALFASVAGADPVEALGEAKLAPLVEAGFLEVDADPPQGDGRRPPAAERAAGASHRMRLAASCPGDAGAGDAAPGRSSTAAAKPAPRSRARQPPAKPAPPKSPFTPPAFKITVATEGAYPPFNYLDRKGLPAGFEMDLAQEACQRMKAECEFVAVKWDELVPGLLDKKFDIVMSSLEVNNERRRRLGMSRRYYLSPGAFIAAKGQPFDGPPTLLRNKKIGVQKDSTHADWLDKSFRRSAQIKRYPTVADALEGARPRTRSTRCSATRCSSGCGRRSRRANAAR